MVEVDAEPRAPDAPPSPEQPAQDESIRESFARLISSGREMADAELAWAKLKARAVTAAAARAAILGLLAFTLLAAGLSLLVAACVIALAPHVGWLGATLIVAGACLLLTVLLGLTAKHIVSSVFKAER